MASEDAPLILTLALDEGAQAFFNRLRQQHFPPERNFLEAHLTLFHHLPGARLSVIKEELEAQSRQEQRMALQVTGVQFLGGGVAYRIESDSLQRLHRSLQARWLPDLTPQDQQRRLPHITVQNKVAPATAQALYQRLAAEFVPFEAVGMALQLWSYEGGPWKWIQTFAFNA